MPTVKINPQTWKRGKKIAVPNGRLRRPMNGNLLNVSEKVANFLIERNYASLVEDNDSSKNINKTNSQPTESTELVDPPVQVSESDFSNNENEEKLEFSPQSRESNSSDDGDEEKSESSVLGSELDSSDDNEENLEPSVSSSESDSSDDNEEKLEPYQQQLLDFFNSKKDFSVVKGIGPQTANDILKGQPYTWAKLISTLPVAKLDSATTYLEKLNEND